MHALGHNLTGAELQRAIEQLEVDGDGAINLPEFLTMMAEKRLDDENFSEEEILKAFRAMDKDGNGTVNEAELKEVMNQLGRCTSWSFAGIYLPRSHIL